MFRFNPEKPKIVKGEIGSKEEEKKDFTEEDIKNLAKDFSKDKEETDGFANFIANKFKKKITRRDFLKIAGGAGIILAIGYKYLKENINNLWVDYQKSKIPEVKKEFEDLQSSIDLLEKLAEYPEMIKKSEKQTLNEFVKDLSKKNFDNLILGERHGFGPTLEKAPYLLEELIKKGQKISAICLEGVSYTDPEHVEIIKKINTKDVLLEKMPKIVGPIELIKLATKYFIEIIGLEKGKPGSYRPDEYDRFREMSERIGEISKERVKDGIVVTYVGQGHVTTDAWENFNLLKRLAGEKDYYPSKEVALENNYTIKEYLEKINFNPMAIQIEDWEKFTKAVDSSLTARMKDLKLKGLPEKYRKIFYEETQKKWSNYILEEKEDFITPYPKGKDNTFAMVIPSKIPKRPPTLTIEKWL